MPPPRSINAVASRDSRFYRNKLTGTAVSRASKMTNNKKSPPLMVPTSTKQSARNTVNLLSPFVPAPTIDILDDGDPSIALTESSSLDLDLKVHERKTRMRLDSRKRLMGAKGDWTNGKPTEEQQEEFCRLKAVQRSECLMGFSQH